MSQRISRDSRTRTHSSRIKCLIWSSLRYVSRARPRMRPGVPTTMWRQLCLVCHGYFWYVHHCRTLWSLIRSGTWKPFIFMRNMKHKFTRVTNYKNRYLVLTCWESICVELMESCKNLGISLSHSTLCLSNNIHSKNCLLNTIVLSFGGMLK